jgi:hypothetical protein
MHLRGIEAKQEKKKDAAEMSIADAVARYFEQESGNRGKGAMEVFILDSLAAYFKANERAVSRFSRR